MTTANLDVLNALLSQLELKSLPAVIGISGAQGSGKSTLAALLVAHFAATGLKAATVSLDDYYLSGAKRAQLAADVHSLLRQRGVPGTHDIQAAIDDATAVLAGRPVALPRFDKALDEPTASLPSQQLDVLVVEGWCVGLQPQNSQELATAISVFESQFDADGRWRNFVNQQLGGQYQQYWQLLKPLIWLQAPGWAQVCRWRAQQEQELIARTGMGMDQNALQHFMGSFERLTLAGFSALAQVSDIQLQLNSAHQVSRISRKPA
ncbi:kinase [Rheinheimera sp. 4Y26]|uniref:kinase n=1 Tax=Rheinheimera sp. 4Y26 TaxID=2977811 RepID=UPI0021B136A6|nr:kinase [Rheinheimera sp. 4Y26]MCT6699753.1 kinase [Rheinheimera sp. 4Y26]